MKIINKFYFSVLFFIFFLGSYQISIGAENCLRPPGLLPNPSLPAGTKNPDMPLEHVVVIMQENHSFDQYFGKLNQEKFYGSQVDGLKDEFYNIGLFNKKYFVNQSKTLCLKDPKHQWKDEHSAWNEGKNDGFARGPGFGRDSNFVMAYFDDSDLPYYYSLANQFAISDRYFSSGLVSTMPNRYFLYAGTAFGKTNNSGGDFKQKTIFEVLNQFKITWKYYTDDKGYLYLFQPFYNKNKAMMKTIVDYENDLKNNNLPQIVFLDAPWDTEDEHPHANIQLGQLWTAKRIQSLMESTYWAASALFLTYDENGGFFDHVPPPTACLPDNIKTGKSDQYDRYGFRVPFVVVSPFAKRHYVSHEVSDHTSILKFIETLFNLPALTRRDANAHDLMDFFDFSNPKYEIEKILPAIIDENRKCGN